MSYYYTVSSSTSASGYSIRYMIKGDMATNIVAKENDMATSADIPGKNLVYTIRLVDMETQEVIAKYDDLVVASINLAVRVAFFRAVKDGVIQTEEHLKKVAVVKTNHGVVPVLDEESA